MTLDAKDLVGLLAALVGVIGYVAYYRGIFRGTTSPHVFSWFGFGLLNGITFFAQVARGGGPGTWVTAISTLATFGIAALALRYGERDITSFDWFCLGGALVGIVLWQSTNDPLAAVIIVSITDNIAFAPTYRKGYLRPYSETLTNYVMSAVKYSLGLFALASFNWTTALYPATLVISNVIFVSLMAYRRRIVAR